MFQIGATLRDARERRGLELEEVERETRVRVRYLRALEDEQFDVLPAGGYRRTFLRGYASFLGLEGDRFVDEYVARFERPELPEPAPAPVPAARPRRGLPVGGFVAIAGAVLVAAGLAAWLVPGHGTVRATVRHRSPTTTAPPKRAVVAPRRLHARAPAPLTIAFTASRGGCWLLVRRGSAGGPALYDGTLAPGRALTLHAAGAWARIGAPWNLTLTVDGVPQQLPARIGNVLVGRNGARSVP